MGAASAFGGVSSFVGGAGSIYSGVKQEEEARRQADIVDREGEIEAARLAEEGKKFGARQEMSYLKSGVLLEGSPLLVLADTNRKNLEDQSNTRASASARSSSLRRSGREAFVSSLFQGISQMAGGGAKAGGL